MEVVEDKVEQSRKAADALSPRTPERTLSFTLMNYETRQRDVQYECVQAELGFLPAQRFFAETFTEIRKFVNGEYGIKLGELFSGGLRQRMSMPTEMTEEAVEAAVSENDQLIQALFKLVEVVPGFQLELMVLSLGVFDKDVDWFKKAIAEPPHRGGLTIEQGFDIMRWFIRQNAVGLRRFFDQEAKSLWDEIILWVVNEGEAPEPEPKQDPEETGAEADTPGGRPSSTSSQATPVSV